MNRYNLTFFGIFGSIGLGLFAVMFLGLHGAACNMHMYAVDKLWADYPNVQRYRDKYRWSHDYCYVVGLPLRRLEHDPT